PPVPIGGHFKYLGRVFDFASKHLIPKREIEKKLSKMLDAISLLHIRTQTKLKIFFQYVPSQLKFELKIYDFTSTFLSGVLDSLYTKHIRKWFEFSASSCVKVSVPQLNIGAWGFLLSNTEPKS